MPQEGKYSKAILFLIVGLVFFGLGFLLLKDTFFETGGVEIIEPNTPDATKSAQIETGNIVVEINGAVNKPGVYHFQTGARVDDALEIAGGISEKANSKYVSQNINRASKLTDGQKIYIPFTDQNPVLGAQNTSSLATGGLISINTASIQELESLPGVGPVTANKVIQGRPYGSLEELLSKKIVSTKVFGEVKEKISL